MSRKHTRNSDEHPLQSDGRRDSPQNTLYRHPRDLTHTRAMQNLLRILTNKIHPRLLSNCKTNQSLLLIIYTEEYRPHTTLSASNAQCWATCEKSGKSITESPLSIANSLDSSSFWYSALTLIFCELASHVCRQEGNDDVLF